MKTPRKNTKEKTPSLRSHKNSPIQDRFDASFIRTKKIEGQARFPPLHVALPLHNLLFRSRPKVVTILCRLYANRVLRSAIPFCPSVAPAAFAVVVVVVVAGV